MAEVRRQEFVVSLADLAANPTKVLAENEFLYVRQADGKLKMMCGDGVTAISALPYTVDIGAMEQAVIDAQTAQGLAEDAQGLAEAAKVAAEQVVIDTKTKLNENTSSIKTIEETLINYNPTAETRLTQTTADRVVSLPKNAGEGGLKSVINGNTLKNETTYNRDTWAEWYKTASVVGDDTGLEFTADGVVGIADVSIGVKKSTKYGLLLYVVDNSLTDVQYLFSGGGVAFPFNNKYMLTGTALGYVGNIKAVYSSSAVFTNNKLQFVLSASEVDGNKIKIKDIRMFELPTDSQIESDFTNLTADQLAARYPYIDGTKSVTAPRVKSVGKNKLSIARELWEVGSISSSTGANSAGTGIHLRTKGLIRVKPNTSHKTSVNTGYSTLSYFEYDIYKTFVKWTASSSAVIFQSNTAYVRMVFSKVDATAISLDELPLALPQIEANTAATTYEPYKESFLYPEPKTLHRLPNGVCDTIENGNYIQRVKEYTLQASDIFALLTTGTNVDRVTIAYQLDYQGYSQIHLGNFHIPTTNGYKAYADSLDNIGYFSGSDTLRFMLAVAKGTYANLAAAQTALAGTKIYYQLAVPVITENVTSGIPISYPSGSIYLEPALADAGVYTDKMSISQTAFPISNLESIKKINAITGEETPLDVSTAVINADKLSFTHPSLVLNDVVFFTYFYAEDGCYGSNSFSYFDSRYVKVDSETDKYYKIDFSIADGVAAFNLVEVE